MKCTHTILWCCAEITRGTVDWIIVMWHAHHQSHDQLYCWHECYNMYIPIQAILDVFSDLYRLCGNAQGEAEGFRLHDSFSQSLLKDHFQSSQQTEHKLIQVNICPISQQTEHKLMQVNICPISQQTEHKLVHANTYSIVQQTEHNICPISQQ